MPLSTPQLCLGALCRGTCCPLLFLLLLLLPAHDGRHLRPDPTTPAAAAGLSNPSGHRGSLEYVIPGDLQLGAILPVHRHVEGQECGEQLRETGAVQIVEAVAYAIKKINGDSTRLPGIKLGMVALDDCATPVTALGQALHFMPVRPPPRHSGAYCRERCGTSNDDTGFKFHDVVGVIGAESSQSSIMISNVLGRFEVPVISPMSTSDLLSDKLNFPYFMRMVPPDRYQVLAILHLLQHFKWTYISVVHSKGGYGLNAARTIQRLAHQYGLCLGATFALSQVPSEEHLRDVVDTMHRLKTRVVVLFTDQEETHALLRQTRRQRLIGHFVWVGSDGVAVNLDDLDGVEDCAVGSLSLKSYSVPVRTFQDYFELLRPGRTSNPWFRHMWSDLFKCTWEDGPVSNASLPRCNSTKPMTECQDYHPESQVSTLIDTVYVFAEALHRLVQRHCPDARREAVRRCVTGKLLLEELKNTDMVGLEGNISFDDSGDIRGRYEVINFRRDERGGYEMQRVALWDATTQQLSINTSDIWWHEQALGGNRTQPESNCGRPCLLGEVYSYYKNTCCWECRQCNPNQITTDNATRCTTCPRYSWPDQANFSSCHPITPFFLEWDHPVVIVFIILAVLGIGACGVVFLIFVRHNNARLIKATSRELSYILLGGVSIQFVILLSSVSKPSPFVCIFNYFSFNVSFAVVYAPLLTRTNRIYRIFRAGKRTKKTPSLTSPLSQVIITLILIAIQVAVNVLVIIVNAPGVTKHMPMETEAYVELTCGTPAQNGFIISLCYNVLLVLVCTYYAFKTRTLPDNFNESRYITLCVYTTLVIWLAFLPTYFLTSRTYHKMILLSSSLVLNASVLLLCLFTPKIYAIYHGATTVTFKYNLKVTQDTPSGLRSQSRPSLDRATVSDFGVGGLQADSRSNSNQSFCRNCQETLVSVTTTQC